jgi:hypothetical protein
MLTTVDAALAELEQELEGPEGRAEHVVEALRFSRCLFDRCADFA